MSAPGDKSPASIGGPLSLLVLQSTPLCNLDCDYCYLPDRSDKRRMPLELIDVVARRVAESGLVADELTVVWHAGEPLVLPVSFYRSARDRVAAHLSPKFLVRHAFQTNATLINEEWCDFFAEPGVSVGVSVDGPAPIHDAHRKTRSGKGTLATTIRGVRLLRARDIPFYSICVLTHDSLEFPDELFDFFLDEGIGRIAFNIEELEGENRRSTLAEGGSEALFRRFLSRFIKRASRADWPLRIREIDQLLAMLGAGPRACANQQTRPFGIVNIDCNGNLSTFSPELLGFGTPRYPSFVIGNVREQSIAEMAAGEALRALRADIDEGVDQCRGSCAYFDYCCGGVPANKVFENGTLASTETMYCRLMRKAIIDVAIESRDLLANLSRSQCPVRVPE